MNNNQQRYKKQGVGFINTNTGRLVRTVKHEERRRANRAETFDKRRRVSEAQQFEETSSRSCDITRKLRRWQVEREIKRKIEAQKKRPAFKVGVVHHKYYSPPVSDKIRVEPVPCHRSGIHKIKHQPTPEKRITRATQKRLEAKLAGLSVTPAKPFNSKLKAKAGKIVKKRLPSLTKQSTRSFAPDNYSFKAPAGLEEIPLFGRFVIPNAVKDSTKKGSEFDLKAEEEKPWPPANIPSINMMTTENLQNSDSLRNSTRKSAARKSITSAISTVEPKTNRRKNSRKRLSSLKTNARLDETIPLFGRFVVPSQIKDYDALAENSISLESNGQKEKLTRENLASRDKMTGEKMPENGSFEASSQDNSSIESVILRVSSEDESPEKKVASQNPEDEDEIDVPIETTTPPRSGTPVPASFSPYIVSSRGKSSARKEQRTKMGINRLSPEEIPTKETVMQNLNISVEDEERTAQYFKFLLQREIDRLTEWCEKWEAIMEEPDITEDVKYLINQAVGQTRLLMRKKFERFRRLVIDCETGKGEMLVQCSDLQGFWDMIHMEIKDCETRFVKLEFLKSKDWIEDQTVVAEKKVTRKKVAKPKPKIKAKSSARSWILAARKKKIADEENIDKCPETQNSESQNSDNRKNRNSRLSLAKSPSRDRENRRRSAIIKTPTSLLKQLKLSDVSKSIISPLAVMKIGKMCKTPKVKLDDSISYVNSDQTPGKGILKKTEESRESSASKAERKVDFDYVFLGQVAPEDEVNDPLQNSINLGKALARIDSLDENNFNDVCSEEDDKNGVKETLQNSIDLGRALARIDDYEADDCEDVKCGSMQNVTLRGAEKRLNFEDDWFDDIENTNIPESAATIEEKTQSMDNNDVSETPTKSAMKKSQSSPKSSKISSPRTSKVLEMSVEERKSENTGNTNRRRSRRANQIPETPIDENEPENSQKTKRISRRTSKILEEDEPEMITNSNRKHSILASKDFETPVEANKPQKTSNASRKSLRRSSKIPEATIEENDLEMTSIGRKVLRNRTIAAETPSSKNRKSLSSSVNEKHNISIDLSKKENNNPQQRWTEINSESCDVVAEKPANENEIKRRKSTRKSVRFNADDCMACTPRSKLPKTPRRRKSGKISLLGESLRQSIVPLSGGDLMAFDTP